MIAPARTAAYEVLRAVNSGRADLPAALARARHGLPDERDRALAGEIATGTLRWQGAFDVVIEAFAKRPVAKLDPEVLDVLRMTAFQLLYLDRIPASAAVNDAVNLVSKSGKRSASGLVNAVLRRISRERNALPLPPAPPDPGDRQGALAYLSSTLSHPAWLAERWLDRYGLTDAAAWARFDNAPAALTLRANTLRTSREALATRLSEHGVATEPSRFAPDGLAVTAGNPLLTPLAGEGLFIVQDESSQLVALLTGVRPGERVLDACASPGGKTTAMAAAAGNAAHIVATDLRGRRVDLLAAAVGAAGASCVTIVQADASAVLPFRAAVFDCVLLDAPCSGLGTLRRDPEIRWRRTEASLAELAARQIAMLHRCADALRPGGRLIYSTCSSEPDENEMAVARFLEARNDVESRPVPLPDALSRFRTPDGHFRTFPFRDELEAFFAAMLVKTKDLQ